MTHKCAGGGNLTTSCSEQERLALLKFKNSIKDENGMLSSWGVGHDCCTWERVGCDDATGRVVSLHLRRKYREDYSLYDRAGFLVEDYNLRSVDEDDYLVGDKVNYCLTELLDLKYLDLSGNDFKNSRIPEFLGSLEKLRYLNLSCACFNGNIPHQIGNISNLKVLDLSSRYCSRDHFYPQTLTTHDLTWISSLSKLEHLDLSGVDLSKSQNFGILLYTIPSLLKLSLSGCGLSSAHLGSHHLNSCRERVGIRHLDLSDNGFGCQLPGFFLNMTSLAFLDLSCDYFNPVSKAWRFENWINMIPFASELRLSDCGIEKLNLSPTNHFNTTRSNIQHLDLSWNEVEGKFPCVLINMSSLLSLDLSVNKLSSSIPIMPNLLKLDISENNLGRIENVGIWRQCHLKELIASDNNLEGELIGPSANVSKCPQNAFEILYLDRNALKSSIPESFEILTNLRGLDLSFNELTNEIPEALGKLRSLQELYLSCNYLTGPIPEFQGKLTKLHLSYNQLNGSIQKSLGRLSTLTEVFLKSNRFTGALPIFLGRLTSLSLFSVSSNFLNEIIPVSIGQHTKLHLLDISDNSLQGVVSEDHFANLSMLKYLDASYNNKLLFKVSHDWIPPFQLKVIRLGSSTIKDGFPQWLRTQRKLDELMLSNASISGALPTWLRLMPIIRVLDLSHNKLIGPLRNIPSVYDSRYKNNSEGIILLQDNLFSGLIPRSLCSRIDLQVLDLSRNRLTGKIPKCLWYMSLTMMILSSNKLSGVIPRYLGHMDPSLIWLQLNDNNFNGEIPHDFGYFGNLVVMDFGENKLSGNIPDWIGKSSEMLSALRLHKNNFTGRIPHSLCESQQLHILDLSQNNLTGSIPDCFGKLDGMKENFLNDFNFREFGYGSMTQVLKGVALEYTKTLQFVINIDLSGNKLVGEIPGALEALDALVGLNLSNNRFCGAIPQNIGNMKSLFSLDLSENELTGMIPRSMTTLYFLSYLN